MTTEYSISIDWGEERESDRYFDKWTNHGRDVAVNSCTHVKNDKDSGVKNRETNMRYGGYCDDCDFSEDSCEPMMNYAYPLYELPGKDKILQIIKETCLTVMENNDSGDVFLVLCGGGMNLSQDIALAYLLAGQRIPDALAYEVSKQYGLSKSGDNWFKMAQACKESLEIASKNYAFGVSEWEKAIEKAKKIEKKEVKV
jgi:hypothetical protein